MASSLSDWVCNSIMNNTFNNAFLGFSRQEAGGEGESEVDSNFNQTVLLLHGDGTNGAQNNTFLDSSANNFTITRNGNTTQGTFSPFSTQAGGWSNYFDGTGDFLTFVKNTTTGDFTCECWFYFTENASIRHVLFGGDNTSGNQTQFAVENDGDIRVIMTSDANTTSTPVTKGAWNHIAFVRNGSSTNNISVYVNGVLVLNTTSTAALNVDRISNIGTAAPAYGYISNARIVNTALYTSAFTPPTQPLTAIAGTSLLTCQSNRFVDNSTNNFAITRNGDVKVTPFSPFAPTAAYSPSVNGGSGYFDGTGDYLTTTPTAFGTGNFTIEGFVYLTSASINSKGIFHVATSSALPSSVTGVALSTGGSGGWGLYYNNGSQNTTNTLTATANTWIHFAVVKDGTTIRVYINGVMNQSQTDTANYTNTTAAIGGFFSTSFLLTGYVSNFRIVASAVYSGTSTTVANFTPPTAPLEPIANTSLLCNFTNAGIFDQTGKNNLETVGNAQIDTTTKQFGTGSMEFDGTGDYLKIPSSENFNFGTGDLTVECWFYANSFSSINNNYIIDFRPSATNGYPLIFIRPSGSAIWLFVNGAERITGSSVSTGQWYHLAWTRSGTSSKLFLNGTQTGSTWTDTTNYLAGRPNIAAGLDGGSALNGFIDDLRITKGVARYTSAFDPPTREFSDQ